MDSSARCRISATTSVGRSAKAVSTAITSLVLGTVGSSIASPAWASLDSKRIACQRSPSRSRAAARNHRGIADSLGHGVVTLLQDGRADELRPEPDHDCQPCPHSQQGCGLHHRRRPRQHPNGCRPDARLLRRARLHLSAVPVYRSFARLVARGHGEQRRDGAKLEGARRRCMHACEAVARSCGAPDRTGRSASFDRAWRPQGQSGVDGITNKPRVARRRGAVNVEEGTNTRPRSCPRERRMQTKTLQQTVTFKAPPQEVYDTLMDSKKHRSLSGEPAKISKKVGGKFTAWGSHLSGINLVLKPGKKIVQAWRATGWWPDHYSIAIFDITKMRGGSRLKFTQIGIPPSRYSGHYRGWIETYWTPMKEIFATGVISDKTRRRVKIDREQRIRTGKFRRKISGEA